MDISCRGGIPAFIRAKERTYLWRTHMKRAFTLIELLVVIAIIAILAAILFPVFAQAKAAAKKTDAISNTKQVTLAAKMYNNDNDDDILPRYDACGVVGYGSPTSTTKIWPN